MGSKSAPLLGCLVIACASFAHGEAAAQATDPRLVWRTIESENFEIHYHEPLGLLARRVAAVSERALAILVRLLEHEPRGRIEVVLSDDADGANGSATATPYNAIHLFASGPEDIGTLSDYDDWLTELITHETTHVVHLDTIGGVPALINSIFGKIYPPNSIQPRWFLEGFAVYEESLHTAGGRNRSTIFDMFLRADVLEDRVLRLDQISNIVDRFPRANSWYLYGSRFVSFIGDTYGHDALSAMSRTYGRQVIPLGINRVARRATGKTFIELYREWVASIEGHYRAQEAEITANGIVEGTRLTSHADDARSPRFLDDRSIVYWAADGDEPAELRIVDAYTGENRGRLDRVGGVASPAPHPDGRQVYYSALEFHRDIYGYSELFRVDRQTGERERLTRGMRAREPDISPDGRNIAFAVNGAGTTHLFVADLSDIEATKRVAYRSRRYEQVFTPRWSPDGRTIAFSAWRRHGYRDILMLDVASGRVEEVTHDRAVDTGPVWAPDGRVLYFSSDRTGVNNVYAYDLAAGETHQVTNVIGGAFSPAISPDGRRLVYLGFRSEGWDVWGIDLEDAPFRPATAYVDDRPEPSESEEVATARSEPYDPMATILPRTWFFRYGQDGFGPHLDITTDGSDVVGYHRYAASVGVGFVYGNVDADLTYVYQRSALPLTVRLYHRVAPRGGLVVGGVSERWIERGVGGEIGLRYFIPRPLFGESISLFYSLAHVSKAEDFGGRLDPNDPPPTLPQTGLLSAIRLGWAWNDVVRTAWDVTPSSGRALSLSLSMAHPLIGSQFESVSFSWAITQFIENPFVEQHVLALRYAGGLSGGDLGRRGLFSIGGFPEVSLIDQLVDQATLGGQALRGYPPFDRSGTQFHLLQAEYRFPIWRVMWSVETLPAYIARVWGSVFMDAGDAFFGSFDLDTFRAGVGGEIFVDFMLGYFLTYTLRLGVARGLMEGGDTQVYAHLGVPF